MGRRSVRKGSCVVEICTLFDKRYLEKGLALFESLNKHSSYCKIHLLCLDEDVNSFFKDKDLYDNLKIITYSIADLENRFFELMSFKNLQLETNLDTPFNKKFVNYCWALTPFFCHYLLQYENVEHILYCDADLYFYDDVSKCLNDLGDDDIGIITHKHPYHLNGNTPSGIYNVGIVYFKNNENGKSCSEFWKNLLLNPQNEYVEKYGTCGDQKYLELFPIKFKKVKVLDDFAYGSPWSFDAYDYVDSKEVIYQNKRQKILFNHFSHFTIKNETWSPSWKGEWGFTISSLNQYVRQDYEDYFASIMNIKRKFLI